MSCHGGETSNIFRICTLKLGEDEAMFDEHIFEMKLFHHHHICWVHVESLSDATRFFNCGFPPATRVGHSFLAQLPKANVSEGTPRIHQ